MSLSLILSEVYHFYAIRKPKQIVNNVKRGQYFAIVSKPTEREFLCAQPEMDCVLSRQNIKAGFNVYCLLARSREKIHQWHLELLPVYLMKPVHL